MFLRKNGRAIAMFLLLATIGFLALHLPLTSATQTPCRPTPDICHPETQRPPCQPFICPDADNGSPATTGHQVRRQ